MNFEPSGSEELLTKDVIAQLTDSVVKRDDSALDASCPDTALHGVNLQHPVVPSPPLEEAAVLGGLDAVDDIDLLFMDP